MDDRYIRNIGAITETENLLLREKRVFVAGCGGLGGYVIEYLLRIGVGMIRVADGDTIDATNLNRQLLSRPDLIGTLKTFAASMRAATVNPDVCFDARPVYVTEENAFGLIQGCDVVIDSLDNIRSRRILKSACDRQGIPYVYGAICGWTAQAAVSYPGDGFLDRIYPTDAEIPEQSSLSFTPALCASVQTALCVSLLLGRDVEHGKLWYLDLQDMFFEKLF